MKLLRNKEVRAALVCYAIAGAAFVAVGFVLSVRCGALMLAATAVFMLLYWFFTKRRYNSIAALSHSIDRLLHGQQALFISENDEGELSILNSEIQKMTLRLKEQTALLQQDKQQLKTAIEDIFHQLRTPLTSMQLAVSMLREENLSKARRLALTRELKTQLERTSLLVETLLKMSKIDAGTVRFKQESLLLRDVVAAAAEPLKIMMELRAQTLFLQLNDERFDGDFLWTAEAFGNLLKNCVEHTPPGGTITVTGEENAIFTALTIHDSGSGFDEMDLPYLFERFYKGKDAGEESIGIGLALARMVVTAQNGTIAAANDEQGGAKFTVKFYKTVV